jgi:hypothetical protein
MVSDVVSSEWSSSRICLQSVEEQIKSLYHLELLSGVRDIAFTTRRLHILDSKFLKPKLRAHQFFKLWYLPGISPWVPYFDRHEKETIAMRRLHDLVTNATRRRLHESDNDSLEDVEADDDKAAADLVAETNDYRVQKAKKEAAKKEAAKKKEAAAEKAQQHTSTLNQPPLTQDYGLLRHLSAFFCKYTLVPRLPWRDFVVSDTGKLSTLMEEAIRRTKAFVLQKRKAAKPPLINCFLVQRLGRDVVDDCFPGEPPRHKGQFLDPATPITLEEFKRYGTDCWFNQCNISLFTHAKPSMDAMRRVPPTYIFSSGEQWSVEAMAASG